jgi:hypothetical protein
VKYKKCTKCSVVKVLEDFPTQSSNFDGRHTHCKECRSKYYASIYNGTKRKEKYYSKHEQEKQVRKEYYRKNKSKYYINKANRRAYTLKATPKWFNSFDSFVLSEAYDLCKIREKHTGVKWEVDHVIPLQGKNVCGLHWHKNWSVISKFENRSKGNKSD